MQHDQRGGSRELDREVPIGHRVERVRAQRLEAEVAGHLLAVDRERRPGERGTAERQAIDTAADVRQPLEVPGEHRVVRHQVMAERDRLRDLQVREAGHDRVAVLVCEIEQRAPQRNQLRGQPVDRAAQPQSHVGRHLVVARAGGMQALASVADAFGELALDVEVYILEIERPLEAPGVDVRGDPVEAALDVGDVLLVDDALRGEHAGMRSRARDVDLCQALVEAHGRRIALDTLGHRFSEATGPGALGRRAGDRRRRRRGRTFGHSGVRLASPRAFVENGRDSPCSVRGFAFQALGLPGVLRSPHPLSRRFCIGHDACMPVGHAVDYKA